MSKKVFGVFLVVIFVILAVGLGYYVAKNNKGEENNPTPTPTPTEEAKKWSKEEMQSFIKPIMEIAYTMDEFIPSEVSEDRVLQNCFSLYALTDLKNELDQEKISSLQKEGETVVLPLENIQSCASRYYGREDFNPTNHQSYLFDNERNVYYTTATYGYTGGPMPTFEVTDVKQNDNLLTLHVQAVYKEEEIQQFKVDNANYEAIVKCNNEKCHLQSIKKK